VFKGNQIARARLRDRRELPLRVRKSADDLRGRFQSRAGSPAPGTHAATSPRARLISIAGRIRAASHAAADAAGIRVRRPTFVRLRPTTPARVPTFRKCRRNVEPCSAAATSPSRLGGASASQQAVDLVDYILQPASRNPRAGSRAGWSGNSRVIHGKPTKCRGGDALPLGASAHRMIAGRTNLSQSQQLSRGPAAAPPGKEGKSRRQHPRQVTLARARA